MTPDKELDDLRLLNCFVKAQSFILLNVSDTFEYATADCEQMSIDDVKLFLTVFEKYGHAATNAYAATKRGYDVMDHPKLRTAAYYSAKAELETLKRTDKYFMMD